MKINLRLVNGVYFLSVVCTHNLDNLFLALPTCNEFLKILLIDFFFRSMNFYNYFI